MGAGAAGRRDGGAAGRRGGGAAGRRAPRMPAQSAHGPLFMPRLAQLYYAPAQTYST